jgi:AbrB family looped-hinge helix DNA binding protein
MTYTITLRPKRQITLPKAITENLDLAVGDSLVIKVDNNRQATITPNKQAALNALKTIQEAFAKSGVPEQEFLDALESDRYGTSSQ